MDASIPGSLVIRVDTLIPGSLGIRVDTLIPGSLGIRVDTLISCNQGGCFNPWISCNQGGRFNPWISWYQGGRLISGSLVIRMDALIPGSPVIRACTLCQGYQRAVWLDSRWWITYIHGKHKQLLHWNKNQNKTKTVPHVNKQSPIIKRIKACSKTTTKRNTWQVYHSYYWTRQIWWQVTCPPTYTVRAMLRDCQNWKRNNNNRIQRSNLRFFTISSLHHEPSPTRTLKWPERNRVQITCNTPSTCHEQRVMLSGMKGQLSY